MPSVPDSVYPYTFPFQLAFKQFSPQTLRNIADRSDSLVLNSEKFLLLSKGIFIAAMTIKERNLSYMPSAKMGGEGGGGEGRKR